MGVKWMAKERGAKKFCVIYQDDDFGTEVLKGAEDGLKDINMSFAEKTSFKRGATDFSAQVSKMKASAATPWCSAPSSARPSAPSAPRARWAGTRSSSAPRRPTPT
jgi:ABC-type branched-subunit amino acid transport system substrate-binding protein